MFSAYIPNPSAADGASVSAGAAIVEGASDAPPGNPTDTKVYSWYTGTVNHTLYLWSPTQAKWIDMIATS